MKQIAFALTSLVVLARMGAAGAQPVDAPGEAPQPPAGARPDSPVAEPPAATPTVAPVPPPAPVAPAPPVAAEAPAKPPKSLEVGSGGGSWTPAALLQFWLYASHQDMTPEGATVPVADESTLNMRIRRAELRVKGDIVPKRILFQVMIDPARALEVSSKKVPVTGGGGGSVTVSQPPSDTGPLTILQDFFITFPSDYVDFSVGQFKIPVSMEGYNSSSKILFPERAPISRKYGDKRDIGLRFEKKLGEHFMYMAQVLNGSGQNKADDDTEKDAALRLEGYLEGFTLGGVGYATIGKREKSSRDRLEVDVKYDAHDLYVIGEYIHGWDSTGGGKAAEGHGTYVEAGYTLFGHLQPMLRVGDLEPVMHKAGDHFWHYEGGANWLFQKHEAKIGLAVAHYAPTKPTPTGNPTRTEGILAFQASF